MNTQFSPLWTDKSSDQRMTGTWRSALPEYSNILSPCRVACPVGGRIAEWVGQVGTQDFHGAWTTLVDNNPFPAIAGRICHHPCETPCNRAVLDETISICALERFVGDMALEEGWAFPPPKAAQKQSVAVIGAGPAGLSAAYQLCRRGIGVHLYEASDQLGGLLRYGVPAYRLDRAILDGEIARILDMGVTVHLNAEVTDAAGLQALRAEHDAVYLATGASRAKHLPGLDYSQPWVIDSAEFLAMTNTGKPTSAGQRMVVIGGGSAAMDVARTARRLGRDVTVLSLEPDALLPAQRVEVEEAKEEGITFLCGAKMQMATPTATGLTLDCTRIDFQPATARGAFKATPIADSAFTLTADTIIPAIGQDADLARWQEVLKGDGPVVGTDANCQTSLDGVFAGGDLASMERFVTEAVGLGKAAADAIAAYIDCKLPSQATPSDTAGYDTINTAYHPTAPALRPTHVDPDKRLISFSEVQNPLSQKDAIAEAGRCFTCGTCTTCDNCYFYCPDMAITKQGQGYLVNSDYCKGCGLCVAECPTGSIRMVEEA